MSTKLYYYRNRERILKRSRERRICEKAVMEQQTPEEQFESMWKFVKDLLRR